MLSICRCASCKNSLGCDVEGFDGKRLFISLNFQRFHSICKECHDMKKLDYHLSFCSVQCLKDFVMDPECLDEYIAEEVMWGRMERAMKGSGEIV